MIEYTINNPKFFINAIASIGNIVDETVLQFGKGLRTYGMDPSRICLYELVLGKSFIDIVSDGRIDVMICVSDFLKILKRLTSSDTIKILFGSSVVTIKGKIGNKNKTFRLRVLTDEDKPEDLMHKLDDRKVDSIFNIDLADFIDMVGDSEIYAEIFRLKTSKNSVKVNGEGVVGDFESEIEADVTGEAQCQYSVVFIKNILKTLGNQEATISFSKAEPIMIYSKLSPDSHLKWYLAPRVDQDEDY